ncbi:hypothetical protein IDJ75_11325 [Mucilaginibacter rigui]|uniref:Uncharacterized protein n=1 Tax=Mucilaginibacter rigui TaxID=534635 RepID=A0ABR7X5M0_9SPHI|nr:hypothetical protein [Mucilaginibacter rigui]MBD1385872.1 hypothetical protein [Mucilaginibacter rigui]
MKSLADQIREQLLKPATAVIAKPQPGKPEKKASPKELPPILFALTAYDTSNNKNMVHARFDEKTVRTMKQFKMATGIEVTRLVSFAVKNLFDTYPEFKTTIKQFIQNNEL